MVQDLIVSTHNLHKLEEIRSTMVVELNLVSLKDLNFNKYIPETGSSFEENAKIKSDVIFKLFNKDVMSDDSGLEVSVLNGAPGVFSARYSGDNATDKENVLKLLGVLKNEGNRKACLRTVISLQWKNKHCFFEGKIDGHIAHVPTGLNGFGYDPIFIPDGYDISFAEMESAEKNKISHRALAIKKMVDFLTTDLAKQK